MSERVIERLLFLAAALGVVTTIGIVTVMAVETFEFFYTLRKNNWDGVWQLDQFPFREDSVAAAKAAIRFLKALHGALDAMDEGALRTAQASHDALAAQRLVQDVLLSSMARTREGEDVNV